MLTTPELTLNEACESDFTHHSHLISQENGKNGTMNILKGNGKVGHIPPFWDDKSARRVVNFLTSF